MSVIFFFVSLHRMPLMAALQTMYYIQFLDERYNEMRRLMNRNFRVKLDGVLCGFSRLCVILGESHAFELVRRALLSTLQIYAPKALCHGHNVKFYAK